MGRCRVRSARGGMDSEMAVATTRAMQAALAGKQPAAARMVHNQMQCLAAACRQAHVVGCPSFSLLA